MAYDIFVAKWIGVGTCVAEKDSRNQTNTIKGILTNTRLSQPNLSEWGQRVKGFFGFQQGTYGREGKKKGEAKAF